MEKLGYELNPKGGNATIKSGPYWSTGKNSAFRILISDMLESDYDVSLRPILRVEKP